MKVYSLPPPQIFLRRSKLSADEINSQTFIAPTNFSWTIQTFTYSPEIFYSYTITKKLVDVKNIFCRLSPKTQTQNSKFAKLFTAAV